MKRLLILTCLLLAAIFASAFSVREWRESIYHQIKSETVKALKDNFKREVTVGKVEGRIVGQVVFHDVAMPGFVRAKKVYVDYSLLKFAYKRDIVPAITKITIVEGDFEINRDTSGRLNALHILPAAEPGGPPPPDFRAILFFQDCTVNYEDRQGFRRDFSLFQGKMQEINGNVDLSRKDRIRIDLSGKIEQLPVPALASIRGDVDLRKEKFRYTISATRLDLTRWGNYALPFDPLRFSDGKINLQLTLSEPKIKGRPLSINGNFTFFNAAAQLAEYQFENTSGRLNINDQGLSVAEASTTVNGLRLSGSGRLSDFTRQNLDFNLAFSNGDLNNLISIFPATRDLDLSGKGDADIHILGTVSSPIASGKASVRQAKFYNQDFTGAANFTFAKNLLKINISKINLKKGTLAGTLNIDFAKEKPIFLANLKLKEIDLPTLAQETPGISGRITGELNLAGPMNKLRGDLTASLYQAEFLGQPIQSTSARFIIKDGEVLLESFSATSPTAFVSASGSISRQLEFDFQANAQGIELAGEGVAGKMQARIDSFEGKVSWTLDDSFIASPLKNLNASGQATLSQGRIGEQRFDFAQGKVDMGNGLLRIENVVFKRQGSSLEASGQTGIGYPTHLEIRGKQINLEDLKIANLILPEEAKDPSGKADISIIVSGELSRETEIASLDPLLDLNASGEVTLSNVKFADINVIRSVMNFRWEDRNLSFPKWSFQTPKSNVELNLSYLKTDRIKGSLSGVIDLFEFRKFSAKYGNLNGKVGLNLVAEGSPADPSISTTFWIEDFVLNKLSFENIEGSLSYSQNVITVTKPVLFMSGKNRFELSGMADLRPLRTEKPEEAYLDLNLKILEAEFSSTLSLLNKINAEFSRRYYAPTPSGKTKIQISALILPNINQFIKRGKINLYRKNGETDYFLKSWDRLYLETEKVEVETTEQNLGGELKGNLSLTGQVKNLSGEFEGEVNKGHYQEFQFDKLQTKIALKENRVKIDKFELSKKGGRLSAQGKAGLDGQIDLELTAVSMPLDILKIVFDQEFKGTFNMRTFLKGESGNPQVSASITGDNLTLAGVHFDKAKIAITKNNGNLVIHEFILQENGNISNVVGSLDLSPSGSVSLEATLKDNALGLFNLVSNDIKWVRGKAEAQLNVRGSPRAPLINGQARVEDADIYVRAIDSEIKNIEGSAEVENNQVKIASLTGIWQGERTKGYQNFIGLAGTIDISRMFSENPMVYLNLSMTPGYIFANLPNLYSGAINIKKLHLYGPLRFDLSQGPMLAGEAEINNAVIYLSRGPNGKRKVFPVTFALKLALNQNVYASMGDVATFDLSNIFMNLEIKSDELKVSGTSAQPSLLGKISVKRGTVTIFNREFELLNAAQQEAYYLLNPDKIKENQALFTGEEGDEGIQPDITITAKVDVEELEEDASGELRKKKVTILSRLLGVVGATEKERVLKASFDSFVEDQNRRPSPAGYSEQQIKVMLLPDFIKSLTGVSKEEDVNANVVVADYISSRFQTLVFRGIERELEQRFGLESLTLEYNFGKDIRQAMGVTETRLLEEKPDWRVGFVKGFFDKFYLDVKYSQANLESGGVESYLNYQLTYKLTPIWSIIYYREEPAGVPELISGDEKITLKAGFSFW